MTDTEEGSSLNQEALGGIARETGEESFDCGETTIDCGMVRHGRREEKRRGEEGRPEASLEGEAQKSPRREALLARAGREAFIREDAGSPASISA